MLGGSEHTEEREKLPIEREEEFIVLGRPFLPTHMILTKCHSDHMQCASFIH